MTPTPPPAADDPLRIVSPRRTIILLAVFCALVAVLGIIVFAVSPTTTLNVIVGLGAFGFFGIGGGIAFVSQWRRSVVLRTDADGISLSPHGRIPWADIDRIGSTSDLLGIRLRRYDALLATAPAEYTAGDLKVSRHHTGWDLTWSRRLLDRSPADAAAALRARLPR